MLTTRDSETNTAYLKIKEQIKSKKKKLSGVPSEEEMPRKNLDKFVAEEKALESQKPTDKQLEEAEESGSEDEVVTQHDEKRHIPRWPCMKPYLIQENGTFRKYWEIAVIFLALYNAFMIPL